MKLLLDQGLPRSASSLLTQQGLDTIHVSEIGMWAAEDSEIMQKAQADNRVVVTLDADFHSILALNNFSSPSVIRIRIETTKYYPSRLSLAIIGDREMQSEFNHGS